MIEFLIKQQVLGIFGSTYELPEEHGAHQWKLLEVTSKEGYWFVLIVCHCRPFAFLDILYVYHIHCHLHLSLWQLEIN